MKKRLEGLSWLFWVFLILLMSTGIGWIVYKGLLNTLLPIDLAIRISVGSGIVACIILGVIFRLGLVEANKIYSIITNIADEL